MANIVKNGLAAALGRRGGGAVLGVTLLVLLKSPLALATAVITDIEFSSRPGSKFEIRLDFDQPPPDIQAYTIDSPARIAMDFPDTKSALPERRYPLSFGNATGVVLLEAGGRTRLVVNLVNLEPYTTRIAGNSLFVEVGMDSGSSFAKRARDPNQVPSPVAPVVSPRSSIENLEFQRSPEGEGRLILTLADPSVNVNVFSEAGIIKLEFLDTTVPEPLLRRYDVTDFATPVTTVDVNTNERGATLSVLAQGNYDYLAYQTDQQYVLSVKPLTPREMEERREEFTYVGDRISLNFQDIEVRAVLQLIADFTELNLVASDTVTGRITLRLQSVPWDQALELILKTKGLDKRQVGNVLLVAPAAEIAERERQQIEANKQLLELAPLRTEFIRVRYASAADVIQLLDAGSEDGGKLISPRGSVIVDVRTNSLIVTDTANKLAEIRSLIDLVDIPIRQVMIEARIVIAQSDLSKELGIQWGGGAFDTVRGGRGVGSISGNTQNVVDINRSIINGTQTDLNYPGALLVDLGVSQRTGGVAIGYTTNNMFLTTELSALEAAGQGEVVSQPKVITGDKQKAIIRSGTEVPFQAATSAGATNVQFKDAVLKLEVTPNITPDDRILLDLIINQDSVGDLVPTGQGGTVPTIDTTELTTKVLVGNGETVVLGGVFRTESIETVNKVPYFGDLPVVGAFFRSTNTQRSKNETLIFITPRILADRLLD